MPHWFHKNAEQGLPKAMPAWLRSVALMVVSAGIVWGSVRVWKERT
jgi:hypothetical protein